MAFLNRVVCLTALALAIFGSIGVSQAIAQECPRAPTGPNTASQVQTLQGRLIYHDGIRQWFELKMDRPLCGQNSVQLVSTDQKSRDFEVLRGCRVASKGALDFSSTGYYSLDVFQSVQKIELVGICTRKLLLPDYSEAKPDKRVRAYTVGMHVNYRVGDHPIVFHVSSAGRELRPWQAYASYMLTGGFVLYGNCGDGFVVDRVFGPASAKPSHFSDPRTPDDMAAFDPENAASAGKRNLDLGFSCVRQ